MSHVTGTCVTDATCDKHHSLNAAAPNCHDFPQILLQWYQNGNQDVSIVSHFRFGFLNTLFDNYLCYKLHGLPWSIWQLDQDKLASTVHLVKGECVTCNAQILVILQKLFYYFYLELLLHLSYRFSEENGLGCQRISQKWLPKWLCFLFDGTKPVPDPTDHSYYTHVFF